MDALFLFLLTYGCKTAPCIHLPRPIGLYNFWTLLKNAEFGLGKYVGLQAGFRVLNWGLFTDLILNEAGNFFPDMKMSWTVNLETKFYIKPKGKLQGFYLGPKFDYGKSVYEETLSGPGETIVQKELNDVMIFGLGVGYKWIWESGFSLEPSDNMAIFLSDLRHTEDNMGDSHNYTNVSWSLDLFALYILSIKVGIAF